MSDEKKNSPDPLKDPMDWYIPHRQAAPKYKKNLNLFPPTPEKPTKAKSETPPTTTYCGCRIL